MANLRSLEKLFQSIAHRDIAQAITIAQSIADDEGRKSRHGARRRLEQALASRPLSSPTAQEVHGTRIADLAIRLQPELAVRDLQLRPEVKQLLAEIIEEWNQRDLLTKMQSKRRSKLLFAGPPGTGKSATAAALGSALRLPVFVVRLDGIVGSFLGETAARLHQVLDWSSKNPCVLIFDEVDAIARTRGWAADVSEIDRVVATFLQELDHVLPAGLLCATTNREEAIDSALLRRFDALVRMPKPSKQEIKLFARAQAVRLGVRWSPSVGHRIQRVHNYADVSRIIEDERRRLILAK